MSDWGPQEDDSGYSTDEIVHLVTGLYDPTRDWQENIETVIDTAYEENWYMEEFVIAMIVMIKRAEK